ncbi:MAG: hypothetical protein PHQ98_00010 [Candidatus ainarchaeum sp.]|nr:hypothetical protein [Candidatus ainarchaeum sp.]
MFSLINRIKMMLKKEKKEQSELNVDYENFKDLIKSNFEIKEKNLVLEISKELTELKFTYEKIINLIKKVEEKDIEEKENLRLNKAVLTAKNQIEKQLGKTIEKIKPIESNDLMQIYEYSNKSHSTLVNEIVSFQRNITYTSIYIKDEMRELGENLQLLLNNYESINEKINKEKDIFEFKKIKEEIELIKQKKGKIIKINEEITDIEKVKAENQLELTNQNKKLDELNKSEEMKKINEFVEQLKTINEKRENIKIEINSLIATIDRPLQRFNSLVESGRWKIDKEYLELSNEYLSNGLNAIKKDINGEKLKQILREVLQAIDKEKIDLKDKEKEKKIEAINNLINYDFFQKTFWDINELQKEEIQINKELSKITTLNEKKDISKIIIQLNEKNDLIEKEINIKNNEIKKIDDEILEINKKVEIFGKKILNKKINIIN